MQEGEGRGREGKERRCTMQGGEGRVREGKERRCREGREGKSNE